MILIQTEEHNFVLEDEECFKHLAQTSGSFRCLDSFLLSQGFKISEASPSQSSQPQWAVASWHCKKMNHSVSDKLPLEFGREIHVDDPRRFF